MNCSSSLRVISQREHASTSGLPGRLSLELCMDTLCLTEVSAPLRRQQSFRVIAGPTRQLHENSLHSERVNSQLTTSITLFTQPCLFDIIPTARCSVRIALLVTAELSKIRNSLVVLKYPRHKRKLRRISTAFAQTVMTADSDYNRCHSYRHSLS